MTKLPSSQVILLAFAALTAFGAFGAFGVALAQTAPSTTTEATEATEAPPVLELISEDLADPADPEATPGEDGEDASGPGDTEEATGGTGGTSGTGGGIGGFFGIDGFGFFGDGDGGNSESGGFGFGDFGFGNLFGDIDFDAVLTCTAQPALTDTADPIEPIDPIDTVTTTPLAINDVEGCNCDVLVQFYDSLFSFGGVLSPGEGGDRPADAEDAGMDGVEGTGMMGGMGGMGGMEGMMGFDFDNFGLPGMISECCASGVDTPNAEFNECLNGKFDEAGEALMAGFEEMFGGMFGEMFGGMDGMTPGGAVTTVPTSESGEAEEPTEELISEDSPDASSYEEEEGEQEDIPASESSGTSEEDAPDVSVAEPTVSSISDPEIGEDGQGQDGEASEPSGAVEGGQGIAETSVQSETETATGISEIGYEIMTNVDLEPLMTCVHPSTLTIFDDEMADGEACTCDVMLTLMDQFADAVLTPELMETKSVKTTEDIGTADTTANYETYETYVEFEAFMGETLSVFTTCCSEGADTPNEEYNECFLREVETTLGGMEELSELFEGLFYLGSESVENEANEENAENEENADAVGEETANGDPSGEPEENEESETGDGTREDASIAFETDSASTIDSAEILDSAAGSIGVGVTLPLIIVSWLSLLVLMVQ